MTERTVPTVEKTAAAAEQAAPAIDPNDPIYQVSAHFVKDGFPAPGLPRTVRYITGHNAEGKGVFLVSDAGDHHRKMGADQALANILYSTTETPVDFNDDKDIKQAMENEPGLHIANGSVVRMIDFGPNVESPMHRAICLGYGVVLEGEFTLTLDSGESRIMRRGDFSIQRATSHKWHNITGNGTQPGRMLWVLLDSKEVTVGGKKIGGFLNQLAGHYEGRYDTSGEDPEAAEKK